MKVLIVDDAPTNLKLLRTVLEAENMQVVDASDGAEAVAVLEQEKVDVIISDILMPRMDGYRLCQEIRKSSQWNGLPFIFHTGTYTTPHDEKLCYDLGGDKYVKKPATAKELVEAVFEVAARGGHRPNVDEPAPSEAAVMKQYNARLVAKLEERNAQLEAAHLQLQRINEELEWRVQQRTSELKAANDELESFACSVSHDLRAPIRHIGGYVEILMRTCAEHLGETNLKHLRTIHGATETMSGLIDALLELSRVGRISIHRCPVDLGELAAAVVSDLRAREPNRAVTVEIGDDLRVEGDPMLLRVVMVNLLGNAWKFTRKTPDARIEFGKLPNGAADTFFVRDNGAGFEMGYVNKLFKPFQRLHGTYEFEGTGIGLATVHRILRRHGGSICAESVDHHGATFYFTVGQGEPARQARVNHLDQHALNF